MTRCPLVYPVWYSSLIKRRLGAYPCVDSKHNQTCSSLYDCISYYKLLLLELCPSTNPFQPACSWAWKPGPLIGYEKVAGFAVYTLLQFVIFALASALRFFPMFVRSFDFIWAEQHSARACKFSVLDDCMYSSSHHESDSSCSSSQVQCLAELQT